MKYQFTVKNPDRRLSDVISENVSGITANKIKILIAKGEVKVNGVKVKDNVIASSGDVVMLFVPSTFIDNLVVQTVYVDDNIIIVDKPKGMDVENNLTQFLAKDFGRLTAVHRLDRNTNGLVVLARNDDAMHSLLQAFKTHTIRKFYRALVHGKPKQDSATMTAYISKDSVNSVSTVSDKPKSRYLTMITKYDIVKVVDSCTLIDVELLTGRTHQIRAHMASIGCPIVGDGKYGRRDGVKGQRLKAYKIIFEDLKSPLEYLNGKVFEISATI